MSLFPSPTILEINQRLIDRSYEYRDTLHPGGILIQYPDELIIPFLTAYLAKLPPGCPARPRAIAREIVGKGTPITPYLGKRIHELLRERGYIPDLSDTSRESNNRLYKIDEKLFG